MNRDKLVEKMLKAKGDVNNTIDLNAYGNGLIDMFDELQKLVKNINYDTVLATGACGAEGYADCDHWQNQREGCHRCNKTFKKHL